MKIYIFDIDGTLTKIDPKLLKAAGYSTHAYWDLLTFQFVQDKETLKNEIAIWRQEVASLNEEAFIISSANMMQRALSQTLHNISEQDVVSFAQKITRDFISAKVVISEAIAFLNSKAEDGHLCILSTGSYQSGAVGFLNALLEEELISSTALEHIMVSGAIVDWARKQLIHANVHNNKIKGLNDLLQARRGFNLEPASINSVHEVYVYADDPDGNDFGILSLATPKNRFVIAHEKNSDESEKLQYSRTTWDHILEQDFKKTCALKR